MVARLNLYTKAAIERIFNMTVSPLSHSLTPLIIDNLFAGNTRAEHLIPLHLPLKLMHSLNKLAIKLALTYK